MLGCALFRYRFTWVHPTVNVLSYSVIAWRARPNQIIPECCLFGINELILRVPAYCPKNLVFLPLCDQFTLIYLPSLYGSIALSVGLSALHAADVLIAETAKTLTTIDTIKKIDIMRLFILSPLYFLCGAASAAPLILQCYAINHKMLFLNNSSPMYIWHY